MSNSDDQPMYSIGAVTRYTGLSAHTLRVWERRYPGFEVNRSGSGRRLYTREDIRRLSLIKKLTAAGHKDSELGALSIDQLEAMCVLPVPSEGLSPRRPRVAVWGEWLPGAMERDRQLLSCVDIVLSTDSVAELNTRLADTRIDSLVMEVDTIERKNLRLFRNAQAHVADGRLIVVYHYAHREIIEELRTLRAQLLRAPIDIGQLIQCVCIERDYGAQHPQDGAYMPAAGEAPPHQYSRRQLSQLSKVSTAIDCECPQHLANLIVALSAFESYSQQCEIRNEDDAALHADIYKTTARARFMMESMLGRVIEAEGIVLHEP